MLTNRRRLGSLATLMMMLATGCIRWGVPDDDGIAEDSSSTDTTDTSDANDTTDDTTTGPEPWPEPWPFSSESRLVVWGKSGIPTTNLAMLANTYAWLAGVAPGEGPLTILWTSDCDPRTDAAGCLAGNVQPFFDMIEGVGTIEFKPLSTVDPSAYDVIVVDFCESVEGPSVATLLADGAGVLALGDPFCTTDAGSSSVVANSTLAHFGVRFIDHELYSHDFTVPADAQAGLLAGVPSLDAWGLALQESIDPVVVVVETLEGVVLSQRSEP